MSKWISVKDSLPVSKLHNTRVLWFDKKSNEIDCTAFCEMPPGFFITTYTHWMLLPEPPKDSK